MNELQRMQYLDAMGIDSFVPRYLLSHAKGPSICELPVATISPTVVESSVNDGVDSPAKMAVGEKLLGLVGQSPADQGPPQSRGMSSPAVALSKDLQTKSVDQVPKDASKLAVVEKALQGKAEVDQVRFSLACWRVSDGLFVIDSCQPGDALPTHALLKNILNAMGLLSSELANGEIINWPLIKGQPDASWAAAAEMVSGYLHGKLLSQPVGSMLLFGKDAACSVLGENTQYETHKVIPLPEFQCEIIVLPSLTELLYSPDQKKAVWQTLNSLSHLFGKSQHDSP